MKGQVLRERAKRLMSPRARHLVRTELNVLHTDGLANTLRWNALLASAWVRNLLNRGHYNLLTPAAASKLRKSDTVFVFGSGYSLNDIAAAEWEHIARHDVFGFNAFYYQHWVPVDFHLLRGGLYGELRWQRYAREVVDAISANSMYRNTVFVMQEEFLAQFTNQLIGYRLFPAIRGLLRYPTSRAMGVLPSRSLGEGLRHVASTLSDAVNCAYCLGWRHIVLVGVDLYDSRYFWLPADQTPTVDRLSATVTAAPVNALGGNRYDEPHYTTRNGVVDLMAEWRAFFEKDGVQLTVYNPRSLLADVMPVYPRRAA